MTHGRPRIDESYADVFGTYHSMNVHELEDGQYLARARLCRLTPSGTWKWVNRVVKAASPKEAEAELMRRVFDVIGCRTQAETNELTEGYHRGHQPVPEERLTAWSSR